MLSKALIPFIPLSQSLGFARDKRERGNKNGERAISLFPYSGGGRGSASKKQEDKKSNPCLQSIPSRELGGALGWSGEEGRTSEIAEFLCFFLCGQRKKE